MPVLRNVDCSKPGIARRRRGRGYVYLDAQGRRISDPEVLDRIRRLVIPPAWEQVWICPHPMGHIQATGIDARGRTQYRYHDRWRTRRDAEKFDQMLEFARALPDVRRIAAEHLSLPDLSRERVLACAVRLLDVGFFRIGTEGYAEKNNTFGLATIHRAHVRLSDPVVTFDFPSKGAKRRLQSVVDPEVFAVVKTLKGRRGGCPELLAYKQGRRWMDLRSTDINAYIKEATGGDYSAKDFRTWNATVLAAVSLGVCARASSAAARKRAVAHAMKEVAHYLGNTPAVCRASYVDPRVIDLYLAGVTVSPALERLDDERHRVGAPWTQGAMEEAVLEMLRTRRAA